MTIHMFRPRVEVNETAYVTGLICVRSDTLELATRVARFVMIDWWSTPEFAIKEEDIDPAEEYEWLYTEGGVVTAFAPIEPEYKGTVTQAELELLQWVEGVTEHEAVEDDDIVTCLQQRMCGGLRKPPSELIAHLFGDALAARCEIELRGD